MARVQVERHLRVVVDAAVLLQQPGDGAVVEVRGGFRLVQLVDELGLTSQKCGHVVEDGLPFPIGIAVGLDERTGRDGAGVHERRGGPVVFQQDGEDGVERQPRGIGADVVEDRLRAVLFQCQNSRVHFRDRFNAEAVVGVAHRDEPAVRQAQTDAEQVGIHVGEIRNVVGILAALDVLAGFVGVVHGGADLIEGETGDHGALLASW